MKDTLHHFDYGKRPEDIKLDSIKQGCVIVDHKLMDDGAYYDGQLIYITNVREGKGVNTLIDGSIYEGWFKNDAAIGKGRFINSHDQTVYEGQWKENQMHG